MTVIAPDFRSLVYSSFMGAQCSIEGQNAYGGFHGSTLAPDGSIVVAGNWYSSNYPLQNAFQSTFQGGPLYTDHCDAVLAKFRPLDALTEIPEPNPLAHWKLDETEDSIAYDSASSNHGTVHGDPLWQPAGGKIDGALELDGIDDYVSADFILDPADGPFSVFAWIKGGSPGQVVISQTNDAGYGWSWLCADSSGNLMTDLRVPGPRGFGPPLVSDFSISDGDWHRIGLVWDTSYRYLYFDGAEVKKDSAPQPTLSSATGGLYFCVTNTLTETTYWFGLIDDIRIYNRAISP